jgi:hypothetical protein
LNRKVELLKITIFIISLFSFINFNVVHAPEGYPYGNHRAKIWYYQTRLAYDHDSGTAGAGEWFFEMNVFESTSGYTGWQSTGKLSIDKDDDGTWLLNITALTRFTLIFGPQKKIDGQSPIGIRTLGLNIQIIFVLVGVWVELEKML